VHDSSGARRQVVSFPASDGYFALAVEAAAWLVHGAPDGMFADELEVTLVHKFPNVQVRRASTIGSTERQVWYAFRDRGVRTHG